MIRISKSYIRCHIFCARVCILFLNIHRTPSTMRARVSPTSSLIFSHTYFLECARLFSHFLESENMFISSNLRKNIRENMEQKMGETRAHMLESVLLIFFLQFLLCFRSCSARYVCVRPVRVRMTYFPLYATYIGCIHDVSSNTATCAYTVLPPHIHPMSPVYMT